MRSTLLGMTVFAAGIGLAITGIAAPPTKPPAPPAVVADPPTVPSLTGFLEGFSWGISHAQVTDLYNKTNGIFDREYAPLLAKMQPGPRRQEADADLQLRKQAFANSWIQFLDTPTGYDTTPLKLEYSYKNNEAIQSLYQGGIKRYFFYFGAPPTDRMWKMYDEIPLKADGPLGKTFQEAVTKLNTQLNVPARIQAADPAQGRSYATADWQDQSTHLRALDRSSENVVGLVREERNTLVNLNTLRANKPVDPFALDPSIAAITKKGVSDPSAPTPATSSSSGTPKKKNK